MIHKNKPATQYEILCPYAGSGSGTDPTVPLFLGTTLIETWGEPFALGTAGILLQLRTSWNGPSYSITVATPQGNYTTTAGIVLSSGYLRVVLVDYKLVVNGDCSATVSWTSLDAYLSVNGGGESHVLTFGAFPRSFVNYNETQNDTVWTADNSTLPGVGHVACTDINGTTGSFSTFGPGGYRYQDPPGGSYVVDPTTEDTSSATGTCTCNADLPAAGDIAGAYTVGGTSSSVWNIAEGIHTNYTCVCDAPTSSIIMGYWYYKTQDFTLKLVGGSAKDNRIKVGTHQLKTTWTCGDGTTTMSGSASTFFNPPTTIGKGKRQVFRVTDQARCNVETFFSGVPCAGDYPPLCDGPVPAFIRCTYSSSAEILWPNVPPCLLSKQPDNLETSQSSYYRANVDDNDDVWVRSSSFSVPVPWFVEKQVTSSGDCSFPNLAEDVGTSVRAVLLHYTRTSAGPTYNTYERKTTNNGKNWTSEVVAIAGAKYGKVIGSTKGHILRAGLVTGSPNVLKGNFQAPGDVSPSSNFNFKDHTGTDLSFEDDSFGLSFANDNTGRILGSFHILGDADVSDWFSTDKARTWFKF